jgi:hypothetical protein
MPQMNLQFVSLATLTLTLSGCYSGSPEPTPSVVARCCELAAPSGLIAHLRRSESCLIATLGSAEDGSAELDLRDAQLLSGSAVLAPRLRLPSELASTLRAGAPTLVFLRPRDDASLAIKAIPLDRDRVSATRSLIAALGPLATGSPTAEHEAAAANALATAILDGTRELRALAARDLRDDQTLASALDEPARSSLWSRLGELPGSDPALPSLLEALAPLSHKVEHTEAMLSLLERPDAPRTLATLTRCLKVAPPPELIPRLEQLCGPEQSPRLQRLVAHVLARLDAPEARAILARHLDAHADPLLQSAALIGHAGTRDQRARSLALDALRTQLLRARSIPRARLEPTLEGRRLDAARRGEVTPAQRRLMAAGYLLARSSIPADRAWLTKRLPELGDAVVMTFVEARRNEAWSDFDQPW